MHYLTLVIEALLKVLQFSGFRCKSVDTNFPELKEVFKTHSIGKESISGIMSIERPSVAKVIEEAGQSKLEKNIKKKYAGMHQKGQTPPELERIIASDKVGVDHGLEKEELESEVPFLVQMSKEYLAKEGMAFRDQVRIKNRRMEVKDLKGSYMNSGEMYSFSQFVEYMRQHDFRVTRRLLLSIAASLYDINNATQCLMIPLAFAKKAYHHMYTLLPISLDSTQNLGEVKEKASLPDWDCEVPPLATQLLFKSVQAFFLLKETLVKRSNVIHHTGAGRMLIACSDAGLEMAGTCCFLVTFMTLDGSYMGSPMSLHSMINSLRKDWKSMPEKESVFMFNGTMTMAQIIKILDAFGCPVHPSHMAVVSDSLTSIIQVRSTNSYSILRPKLQHIAVKTYVTLISLGMSPIRNVYEFNQRNEAGIIFPPDLLTKIDANLSPEKMIERAHQVMNIDWMCSHPSSWPISRRIRGKINLTKMADELLVDLSYIERLKLEIHRQDRLCDGTVGSPLPIFGKKSNEEEDQVVSKQMRIKTPLLPTPLSQRKLFFEDLTTRYFSNILHPRDDRTNVRKVSLIGVISLVLFWIQRMKLRLKKNQQLITKTERRKIIKDRTLISDRGQQWSRYCGYPLCLKQGEGASCNHPDSNWGGRRHNCELPRNERWRNAVNETTRHKPHFIRKEFYPDDSDSYFGQEHLFAATHPELKRQPRDWVPAAIPSNGSKATLLRPWQVKQRLFCVDTECILCTHNTCTEQECKGCIPKLSNYFQVVLFIKKHLLEPANGIDHWSYTGKLVELVSHFEMSSLWRRDLGNRALDLIAAAIPAPEDMIDGYQVVRSRVGRGFQLHWATGRLVRDTTNVSHPVNFGKPYYRMIDSKSVISMLLITQLHKSFHHHSEFGVRHKLEMLGIKVYHFKNMIKRAVEDCRTCTIDEIGAGHKRKLMYRSSVGPADLGSICEWNSSAAGTLFVSDTVGPLRVICDCGNGELSVHVIIFVQLFVGRVLMYPIQNLGIKEVHAATVQLVGTEGKCSLLVVDPASAFAAMATDLGPVETEPGENMSEMLEELNKRRKVNLFHRILYNRYIENALDKGLQVKISPTNSSRQQSRAEFQVGKLKMFFANERMFGTRSKATMSEAELVQRLGIVCNTFNNLPSLRLSDHVWLSPNDVLTASGRIVLHEDFPKLFENSPKSKILREAISDMRTISDTIKRSLFAFYLPLLRDSKLQKAKEGKSGAPIELLCRGSVVVDYKEIKKSHSLRKSLARVELVSKGRRWALISKVRSSDLQSSELRKSLYLCAKHKKEGCMACIRKVLDRHKTIYDIVSRRSDELYLLYSPRTDNVEEVFPRWSIPSIWENQYKSNTWDFGTLFIPATKEQLIGQQKILDNLERKESQRGETSSEGK